MDPSTPTPSPNPFALHRRAFLGRSLGCLAGLALADLMGGRGAALGTAGPSIAPGGPLAPKAPHFDPKAKAVICLFQHGGPSQMDLFDPKPLLNKFNGKPYEGELEVHFHTQSGKVLGTPYQFAKRGRSGMELSELLPHTSGIVDEITLVRSMMTESVDHEQALRMIHSGRTTSGRPAWGAWVLYGLGTERSDLPAYVVLSDPGGMPIDGIQNWTSGFLPAVYQGTQFRAGAAPVFNLKTPEGVSPAARENQLRLIDQINRDHLSRHPANQELAARIENFELAARMQTSVPGVLDVDSEPEHIKKLYGMDKPATAEYARRCIIARRLVERGVRFVQLYMAGQPWDTHDKNAARLKDLTARTDQPSAALVLDLKQRGLLDSTIVMWGGEFGRLPISQGADGRDHNRHAFSIWLAGGGFKRGHLHGATDDFGYRAVSDVVRVPDLHATLLHALGLDHARLNFFHDGIQDTLTDVLVTGARPNLKLLA